MVLSQWVLIRVTGREGKVHLGLSCSDSDSGGVGGRPGISTFPTDLSPLPTFGVFPPLFFEQGLAVPQGLVSN